MVKNGIELVLRSWQEFMDGSSRVVGGTESRVLFALSRI